MSIINKLISKKSAKVIITSYDLATYHLKNFEDMNIKFVIADETHYLKNGLSKRS